MRSCRYFKRLSIARSGARTLALSIADPIDSPSRHRNPSVLLDSATGTLHARVLLKQESDHEQGQGEQEADVFRGRRELAFHIGAPTSGLTSTGACSAHGDGQRRCGKRWMPCHVPKQGMPRQPNSGYRADKWSSWRPPRPHSAAAKPPASSARHCRAGRRRCQRARRITPVYSLCDRIFLRSAATLRANCVIRPIDPKGQA